MTENIVTEVWRAVLGYEGWYEASSEGRVRAIQRPFKGGPRCFNETYPLILTPLKYRKGYLKYRLGVCGGLHVGTRYFAHRIVYEAFHGAIPDGLTVNHIDGNTANNRPINLEAATYLQQSQHARRLGLLPWQKRARALPAITDDDVREIRRAHAAGEATYGSLAARYGVVPGTIGHILKRRHWKHVA